MATVTDYTGNAGLGFGSNPNIGFDVINLSGVNQALRDVLLADADQNNRLFQQKVKDRDNLYQMLATNQVQSGKITDKDRAVFDEAQRRQQAAFDAIQGANDARGIENYYKATNDLRNVTTQAQARYLGLTELQKEAASKTLPSEQKAWSQHLANQEQKPFWDTVDPYQQTLKNDFEGMKGVISKNAQLGGGDTSTTRESLTTTNRNGKTTVTSTQTTGPASAASARVPRGTITTTANGQLNPVVTSSQYYDYPTFRRNAMEANVGDESQQIYQQRWRETFESLDPNTFKRNIDLINQRLREYNTERGLTDKDQGFVTDIQYIQNPQTGQIQISETTPDFAAKTTLASIDGPYVNTSSQFNKDIAEYLDDQGRLALDWYKAKTARQRGDVYAKWIDFKTKEPGSEQLLQNWNSITDKVIPNGMMLSSGGNKIGNIDVVWADELPEGFKSVAGVSQDAKGKVLARQLTPKISNKGGRPYYDVFYYDLNGNKVDKTNPTLKEGYDIASQNGYRGSIEEFIKLQVKKGNIQLELEGKNGRANAISAIESQRAINATATSKGEDNIYSELPQEE